MLSGLRDTKADANKPGFVIVETNYRVYAYTGTEIASFALCTMPFPAPRLNLDSSLFFQLHAESPLQIALLALFTEMQYRFPSFCLGILTRESIRSALKSGITAEQIINFLTINAHPSLVNATTPVPSTMMDQIRLWEIERDRFIFRDGVLYSQFLSQSDFEVLRNYARVSCVNLP